MCISHKIKLPLPEDPLLKVTVLRKAIIRIIYNKLIKLETNTILANIVHWANSIRILSQETKVHKMKKKKKKRKKRLMRAELRTTSLTRLKVAKEKRKKIRPM